MSCHVSDPDCQILVLGTTRGNTSTDYWRFNSHWQYILLGHPSYRINRSGWEILVLGLVIFPSSTNKASSADVIAGPAPLQ